MSEVGKFLSYRILGKQTEVYSNGVNIGVLSNSELINLIRAQGFENIIDISENNEKIYIKTRKYEHIVYVSNNNLIVEYDGLRFSFGKLSRLFMLFGLKKKIAAAVEINQMVDRLYLNYSPNSMINPNIYKNTSKGSVLINLSVIPFIIAIISMILFAINARNNVIDYVKNAYVYDNKSVTYADIIEYSLDNCKWNEFKGNNDRICVEVVGNAKWDNNTEVILQFLYSSIYSLNNIKPDTEFYCTYASIGGESYDDPSYIISELYENYINKNN